MKKYYSHLVKKVVNVKNLVTVEYLDITPDFYYAEETHSFYEFVYVNEGSIICATSKGEITLERNDFYLIPPQTPHHYKAAATPNAAIFVVCFNCNCALMELIRGKTALDDAQKTLMHVVFSESKKAFSFPFEKKIVPLDKPSFGSQQLVESYIETLLIDLIRKKLDDHPEITVVSKNANFKNNIVNDVVALLKKQLYGSISLEEIQNSLYYSKTYLNGIFKKTTGVSIIHYYRNMKIEEAKVLIKKGERIVDVSDKLNFDSPNYFSKVFKSVTGQTPTQYKKSI